MNSTFESKLNEIIKLMTEKGYDPIDQLTGYVELKNPDYITRHGGARDKIKELDIEEIKNYLKTHTNR